MMSLNNGDGNVPFASITSEQMMARQGVSASVLLTPKALLEALSHPPQETSSLRSP